MDIHVNRRIVNPALVIIIVFRNKCELNKHTNTVVFLFFLLLRILFSHLAMISQLKI